MNDQRVTGEFPTRTFHHCRQCRSKLAAVVELEAAAFCSRGCHGLFYRTRCLVCEKPKSAQARSPYCSHTCKLEAQRNAAVVREFRASSVAEYAKNAVQQNQALTGKVSAILTRGSGQATPDSKSPCAAVTFLRDFCPRGWRWAVYSDGLEFELSDTIEGNADARAFVLFDGAEWVIKYPRTYPRQLAFTNRDDALREAVSLAAGALPLDAALSKRERSYRDQVERYLKNPTVLQF